MTAVSRLLSAASILAAGIAICALAPDASNAHFIVVNNNDYYENSRGNNFGTALKLEGTEKNPVLNQVAELATGEPSVAQDSFTPTVQVVRQGSDICIFLADSAGAGASTPNEITSFKYPSLQPIGSFSDSEVASPELLGIMIVARSGQLFAAYDGYDNGNPVGNYLASWEINPGCTLTLLQTYTITQALSNMALTPNGVALIISYAAGAANGGADYDSFSIGPGGALTERGPYTTGAQQAWGLDITADSKYVIFSVTPGTCNPNCYTQVQVSGINPNGSLGSLATFGGDGSLGKAYPGGWVRLSPDERFLFLTDDATEVTTLNFTENPLNFSYSGCLTELKVPNGEPSVVGQAIATGATAGAGGAIYVAEQWNFSSVALLSVNSSTGCSTEAPESPFISSDPQAAYSSLVAWPPRPF